MSNTENTNSFSLISILKGIGISIPIILVLIGGYVNIMTKLTSLEEKINSGNEKYIELKIEVSELKKKFENHVNERLEVQSKLLP